MPILETRGLRKTYGDGDTLVKAVRGIDLTIEKEEMVAIVGPSGCGKSSLLSMLGGVDLPSEGQVLLDNIDLATLSDDERTQIRRKRIGFIFQSFNLLPSLSAEENVALPLELDGVARKTAMQRQKPACRSWDGAAFASFAWRAIWWRTAASRHRDCTCDQATFVAG